MRASPGWETVLDSAPCGFLCFSDQGIMLQANATLLGWLGYAADELIGQKLELVFVPGGRIFHQTHFFPLLKLQGEVEEIYFSLRTKAGVEFPMLLNAKRRAVADGLANAATTEPDWVNDCILMPIRQRARFEGELLQAKALAKANELQARAAMLEAEQARKQLQVLNQELRLRTEQAEAASQAKGQFLANMSHELRTPMNAVLGMLQLLHRSQLNARQVDYVEKTQTAAQSLLAILNDILDFSKIEAGKMVVEQQAFEIDPLLRDLSVILSASVGEKPLEILYDLDPNLPNTLVGDAMRLKQVLINLCGNAVKFTAQGEVVVSIGVSELAHQQYQVRFAVSDSGIGIAAEKLTTIFEGFSQAEASTTRRYGGTGLGLAISQRFVELMGGAIQVESQPGQGSCFHFTLLMQGQGSESPIPRPLNLRYEPDHESDHESGHDADSAATPQQVLSLVPEPPFRVLVIDDNAMARRVIASLVIGLGWDVDLAATARQAMDKIGSAQHLGLAYELILADRSLSDADGWILSHEMRQASPASLIIMVTAHGREIIEHSNHESRPLDGFLVKPITASMLADTVSEAKAVRLGTHTGPTGSAAPRRQRLTNMRILLVEDNPLNQQVACELLVAEGAQLQVANDGLEAVAAVMGSAGEPFSAILMDVQMPVMDGYGASNMIRHSLLQLDLVIIAMTANAMGSDREKCLEAGMNGYIGKPFDLDELVATLLRLVPPEAYVQASGLPNLAAAPDAATSAGLDHANQANQARPANQANQGERVVLDLSTALARLGGDQSLLNLVLQMLLADLLALAQKWQQHSQPGALERLLHTLKGNAGTVGAQQLAARIAEIEHSLHQDGGNLAAQPGIALLEPCLSDTIGAMQAALANSGGDSRAGAIV